MATFSNFKSTLVAAADTAAGASSAATTVVADINALIALTGMSDGDQAFVTSNNNLYFYSSGWYKIATVSNDSPSAITGVSGAYSLDVSGGTTTITAVSTDPEGLPLTWSYSTSGLGNIATISQASNVFTITPSTNTANAGSFTLTISVTDGINGAVSASSTLTLQFVVANSKYTTALITAVDTSDNNNITDASSNNHTITVTGDVIAGTFSPYRNSGYSTNFFGVADFLTITDSSLELSGEFTVSFWLHLNSLKNYNTPFHWSDFGGNGSGYDNDIYIDSSGQIYTRLRTTTVQSSSNTISAGQWYYLTVTRNSSNVIKVWVDESEEISYTAAGTLDNYISIGYNPYNGGRNYLDGYIRDFKITDASVSSPTIPLEPVASDSNTKLLACALPYFADASSSNLTVNRSGNPTIYPFTPYDHQEYSASNNGGSIYLDGSGDYLEPTTSAIGAFGNNDFTIEFWINPSSIGADQVILDCRPLGSNGNYIDIFLAPSGQIGTYINLATRLSGGPIIANTWTHIAVVGTSSGTTLYINGSQVDTDNYTASYLSSASRPRIGASGYHSGISYPFSGYISDIKIVEGTALYTSDFTRPASPLSSSGASLHIKGTDASIIDKTQTGNVLLSGVTGSTTQAKFASTKSIDVTSAANYAVAQNIDGNFGSGSFTIECWIWPETLDITYAQNALGTVLDLDVSLGSGTDWWVIHQTNNGGLEFASNSGNVLTSTNSVLTAQTWHHIAIVRSGSTLTWYVDGTARGTTSYSNSLGSVRDLHIGKQSGVNRYFKGYIQDIRITKGLARYTSNFTPPTSELQG